MWTVKKVFTECYNTTYSKIRENTAVSLQSIIQIFCTPNSQIMRKGWVIFREIMELCFLSPFHNIGDEISIHQDECS